MYSESDDTSKPEVPQTFNWLRILLIGFALPLFILLGFWQLDRADQKETLIKEYAGVARQLNSSDEALGLLGSLSLLPVKFRIDAVDTRYYLLDNRISNGRPGYEVLLPARLGAGWLLVNLGWTAAGNDRRILPQLELNQEYPDVLEGVLSKPENLLQLSDVREAFSSWPKRIQQVNTDVIGEDLNLRLSPLYIKLQTAVSSAITPHQPTIASMPPERHVGYAVQWFALAFALLCWLWFSRRFRRT